MELLYATIVLSKTNDKGIMSILGNEGNGVQRGFTEKAVSLVKKGKSKAEIAELFEVGIATLYRWLKKKAAGESLKPTKPSGFIRKIDPQMLAEYVKKHPDHTLAEMKQNLGFGISAIWYNS